MIYQEVNITAKAASKRYALILSSFDGVWSRIANFKDPLAPRTRRRMVDRAKAIATTFFEAERRLIHYEMLPIAATARRDALRELTAPETAEELTTRVRAHLSASGEHLESELSTQLTRDIEALVVALKKRILEVDLVVASEAINRDNAVVKTRIAMTGPNFMFKDRLGRRIPSPVFVRAAWRQTLLLARIETKLMTYAQFGVLEVKVAHHNAAHRHAGMVFPLVGPGSYLDIRDEVFHPNAETDVLPA